MFTSVSEECQAGECTRCPGVFYTDQMGDKPVFCVHWCHREPEGEHYSANLHSAQRDDGRYQELAERSGPLFLGSPFRLLFPRRLALLAGR